MKLEPRKRKNKQPLPNFLKIQEHLLKIQRQNSCMQCGVGDDDLRRIPVVKRHAGVHESSFAVPVSFHFASPVGKTNHMLNSVNM